jgi:hypothetical protein
MINIFSLCAWTPYSSDSDHSDVQPRTGSYDFDSRFIEERPAQGWDARVKAWLPFYRNLAVTGAYTQWYGERVGMFGHKDLEADPKVWSYGLEYTPIPLVSGFINQRSSERGRTETEFGLNFTYRFGMPLEEQLRHSQVAELRTVAAARHEFVDRENRIILEYRAKQGAYRIEQLAPLGSDLYPFRILDGFGEIVTGLTVSVRVRDGGSYLGVDAAPAVSNRTYLTDGNGEFVIRLDGAPGPTPVVIRAGDAAGIYVLGGAAAPLNGLVLTFSGGGAFVTGGPQGYQTVVAMTVKKYVNGVEDTTWTPDGNVTWTVTSNVSGLYVDAANGVWKRGVAARNGLIWVASATESVDGATDWSTDEIKVSSTQGSAPTGATAFLADIVGSRTITVTAEDNSDSTGAQTFTFGAGPLSVFSKTGTGDIKWADNASNNQSGGFQDQTNAFPAAAFCGGTVNNDVAVTGTYTDANAGFNVNSGGGWSSSGHQATGYSAYSRYAETSRLATTDQLLAVSVYNASYNSVVQRKGAAPAAGWFPFGSNNFAWTGEVYFTGSDFYAGFVPLGVGNSGGWGAVHGAPAVAVCLP